MQPKWHSPRNILIAILLSALIAAATWELMIFEIPVLFASIVWTGRRSPAAACVQILIATAVVTAAILAPVKQVDEVLDREITVPSKSLTLADLRQATEMRGDRRLIPTILSWRIPSKLRTQPVTFFQEKLTLREFIAAVESQTPLRHRFGYCGTGATLLFGASPMGYLSFRDPQHSYVTEDESSDSPESPPLSPPSAAR